MEVKHGYKQTEVGVIPEDWEVKSLGKIGECLIGLTYRPSDVRSHGTLVLRSSNIQEGTLRFGDNVFVETEIPQLIMARPGDILVCVRNGRPLTLLYCPHVTHRHTNIRVAQKLGDCEGVASGFSEAGPKRSP